MKPAVVAVIAIAVGVAGFFGGMKFEDYQRTNARSTANRQFQAGANGQFSGRGRAGGGRVVGDIMSQDDKSITVKMADGSSKIVILSTTTTYNKAAEGTKSDLKVGERVGVFGTDNSDGSVTAQNIQLNPMFRGATPSGTPRP